MRGIAKVRPGLTAALVIFVGLSAGVAFRNFTWQQEERRIERIDLIIERLDLLALHWSEAENAFRRFTASAGNADLESGRDALRQVVKDQNEFAAMCAKNPVLQRSAGVIAGLVGREVQLLIRSTPPPTPAAVSEALSGLDRAGVSDALLSAIDSTIAAEHAQIRERSALKRESMEVSRFLFGTGAILTIALILLAARRIAADYDLRTETERKLAVKDVQYRQVVELAGDIIYRTDGEGRFTYCNQSALSMLYYTEGEVIGRPWLMVIRQDKRREAERFYLRQFLRKQKTTYYEVPIIDGHGRERWLGQNAQLVMEAGGTWGFQGIARDITERKRAEIELQRSRSFVERIAATTPGILYVYDILQQKNVFSNREVLAVLGYRPEEILNFERISSHLVHPDDQSMIDAHYQGMRYAQDGEIRRLEYRTRHQDGHWVWLAGRETAFERGPDNLVTQIVGIMQDITVRKAAQEKLAYQANYDALTGLPNRHYFWTRLHTALRRGSIEHSSVSLCLFDVDHFKDINDRFGHSVGDEVLETVGNIVRQELRPYDTAGRLGGDEFCFVLPGTDEDEAARVADRIRERLSTLAFGIQSGSPFTVTATFGVAESRPDIDAKNLMDAADRALYRAKSAGRNRVCVGA